MPAGALRQPSRSQEEVARACGRAAPAESVAVPVPGLVPDLPGVLFPGIAALPNQDRVAAQPVKHGAGRAPRHLDAAPEADRQDIDSIRRFGGALVQDVEEADGLDVVVPEFDPGGAGRAEGEEIDQAAPHRVLSRLLDGRGPREPPRLQRLDQIIAAQHLPGLDRVAQLRQVVGKGRHFLERAPGGDQDPRPPREEGLERFDALAGQLQAGVVAIRGESLALGVVHRRAWTQQHPQGRSGARRPRSGRKPRGARDGGADGWPAPRRRRGEGSRGRRPPSALRREWEGRSPACERRRWKRRPPSRDAIPG